MTVSISGTGGLTFNDNSVQDTAATGFGFKSRIINGAMVIDQRNAGASVSTSASYPVDRFYVVEGTSATFTSQRSTTAPTGFTNSLLFTVGTGATAGASEQVQIRQAIEGFNIADFGWGTASAKTVTLSFQVRASLTGTYCVFLQDTNATLSYVAEYTISAANTWESKSITIAGPTTGTFDTTNSTGVMIGWDLGSGSNFNATAGTWQSAVSARRTTNQANLIGTSSATFFITGVQLEKGSTATSFDYRPYELALCQRYFEKSYDQNTAPATNTTTGTFNFSGASEGNGNVIVPIQYSTKRTAPTLTGYLAAGTSGSWNYERSGSSSTGSIIFDRTSDRESRAYIAVGSNFVAAYVYGHWIASAEL